MTGSEIIGIVLSILNWVPFRIKAWLRWAKPIRLPKATTYLGYVDLGVSEYAGVNWLLKYQKPFGAHGHGDYLWHLQQGRPINNTSDAVRRLHIEGPYCPECETNFELNFELVETRSLWRFWKKYKWSCINCDFKKRSKKRAYDVRWVAEKLFEAKLRKAFQKGCMGILWLP
ncbi:MAG: hypothetical protein WBC55_01340 [Dehalococcoidia bacterium]